MVKKILILVLAIAFKINAQINLVPNGSFESYTCCPVGTAQLDCTSNWIMADASTDYYNACSPPGNMSVPLNVRGYQNAANGSAYIGMITYGLNESNPPYYREPAMTKLTQKLQVGTKYFVSFKAVLTINDFEGCCASNKLGALFSKNAYSMINKAPINNFAHVYSNTIITDTLNWSMVSGSFISDSAYEYITIGNFFTSPNTSFIDYKNNFPQTSGAYYYIDDIRLSTDSNFVYVGSKPLIASNSLIKIYPNSVIDDIVIESTIEHLTVNLYDNLGRLILHRQIQKSGKLNLNSISTGLYLFVAINERNNEIILTKKIHKQ